MNFNNMILIFYYKKLCTHIHFLYIERRKFVVLGFIVIYTQTESLQNLCTLNCMKLYILYYFTHI